jgi:hypothetical protein
LHCEGIELNQLQLETIRRKNFNKLDTAYRPKKNAMEIDINNSIEHEIAKFFCVWLIRKGLPAEQLPEIFENDWDDGILATDFDCDDSEIKESWRRPVVVTEARFKPANVISAYHSDKHKSQKQILKEMTEVTQKLTRRTDIFILDTGQCVEIETDKTIEKENAITVRI